MEEGIMMQALTFLSKVFNNKTFAGFVYCKNKFLRGWEERGFADCGMWILDCGMRIADWVSWYLAPVSQPQTQLLKIH